MIPIILGGIAIVTSIYGGTKTVEGLKNISNAKEIVKKAKRRHTRARKRVERHRVLLNEEAEKYGKLLINVIRTTVHDMVNLLDKIGKTSKVKKINLMHKIGISEKELSEFKEEISFLDEEILSGVGKGVVTGLATQASVWVFVGLFGTASTGTAISSLSGAAATNATLAWLGGGSLAAGGGGMALGSLVLGGITVAPAVLISGLIIASKGEKALTQAKKFEKEISKHIEELKTLEQFLEKVRKRVQELYELASNLDLRAQIALKELKSKKMDINDCNYLKKIAKAVQLVKALVEISRVPVLTEEGDLTIESYRIQTKFKSLMEEV